MRAAPQAATVRLIPLREFNAAVASFEKRYPDFRVYVAEATRLMPEMDTSAGIANLAHFLEGMYLIAKNASFSKQGAQPKDSPATALAADPEFSRLPTATQMRFLRAVEPDLVKYADSQLEIILIGLASKQDRGSLK